MTSGTKRKWYHWLNRILRWTIPIIIFYIIFQKIDLATFRQNVSQTNPWLYALGMLHFPCLILIGALRWRFLLNQYYRQNVSLSYALRHYWIGLGLGFFAPGSLGWDAYRVVVSGRHLGQYASGAAIIVVEKLMALVTCMSLIICLYPIVPITVVPEIERVFNLAYLLFFACIFLIAGTVFALRHRVLSALLERMERYLTGMLRSLMGKLRMGKAESMRLSFRSLAAPLASPRQLLGTIFLSFAIQLVNALKSQIFFCSLGYDLPFIVNLFVGPTLYFIFLLPISLGSLGIREGVFVVLYGLFGVPAEVALLVSFFSLSGLLMNNLIGGLIMVFSNVRKETLDRAISDETSAEQKQP